MLRFAGLVFAWTTILFFAGPAIAWNATGHRIIAAIAYDRLTPAARARVDELLRHHPDYEEMFLRDAPADATSRARAAFIAASVWADQIKGDPRFYDQQRDVDAPPPLLTGYPDMGRHQTWHYFDTPYAPDGAHVEKQLPPNARSELKRMIPLIASAPDSVANPVYLLPWFEHIAGDVHQPLHCVSRFLQSQPKGDAGGNSVFVEPGRNLHSFWDGSAGSDTTEAYVNRFAAEVSIEHPAPRRVSEKPEKWIEEGFRLSISEVYTFGLETGSREKPIHLTAEYQANAKRVARERIAIAGYHLAAILNEKLK